MALSRTPHGVVDMAAPVFAALVWLGEFPSPSVTLLGLITLFAGYTTVYALNDIVDFKSDRKKAENGVFQNSQGDLDAVLVRHPMARGMIRYWEGVAWAVAWGLVAILGAYTLNPVCVYIFLAAASLEALYCLLWNVSPIRTLVSGVVKTSGAVAAIYGVDSSPSFLFVAVLFLFLFFWEIGGQNIPNDWTDLDLDGAFKARTIPLTLGLELSSFMILWSNLAVLVLSVFVFITSKFQYGMIYVLLSLCAGGVFLLYPSIRLYRSPTRENAMALFNQASYYPMVLLGIVLLKIIF
ncbi:MAG: UbiA family prenyltransferase [Proteobacteria bacterium]|nr:UbiA family prenyltransferase [Pseudomonadota bacterium]MBU4469781.1 UbiA family prenyltransferase [Pseudomonadota bacterium]